MDQQKINNKKSQTKARQTSLNMDARLNVLETMHIFQTEQ